MILSVPGIFYDAVDRANPEKLVSYFNTYGKRGSLTDSRTHQFPVGELYGWGGVTMFLPDRYDDMIAHLNVWSSLSVDFSVIERALCMLSVFLLKEPNALGMFIADQGCGATITPAIRDNINIPDSITDYFSKTHLNKPVNVLPNLRHHMADVLWFNSPGDNIPSNL